jgi:predicted nicotinamide N-methyase
MEHEADFLDELIASNRAEKALSECTDPSAPLAARTRAAATLTEPANARSLPASSLAQLQNAASSTHDDLLASSLNAAVSSIESSLAEQHAHPKSVKNVRVREGVHVTVREGSVTHGVGAKLWKSAAEVAHVCIEEKPREVLRNKRVLELGTGVGLLAIALAQSSLATEIITTDCDELALQLAEENLHENAQLLANKTPIRLRYLDWRSCNDEHIHEQVQPPFDTIVGSELLYGSEHAEQMAEAISAFLARPYGVCLIGQAVRDRAMVDRFASECLPRRGMYVESEVQLCEDSLDEYEGGYTYITVRWRSDR